jgi:hypothetical protein
MLRRTGASFKIVDFANRPKTRPTKLRGGDFSPAAIAIHAEQCASIWVTSILPHRRSLSGVRRSSRSFISSAAAISKRSFMLKAFFHFPPALFIDRSNGPAQNRHSGKKFLEFPLESNPVQKWPILEAGYL